MPGDPERGESTFLAFTSQNAFAGTRFTTVLEGLILHERLEVHWNYPETSPL